MSICHAKFFKVPNGNTVLRSPYQQTLRIATSARCTSFLRAYGEAGRCQPKIVNIIKNRKQGCFFLFKNPGVKRFILT